MTASEVLYSLRAFGSSPAYDQFVSAQRLVEYVLSLLFGARV